MGGLNSILHCQWRAYWRRFARSGNLNAGNQGILLIISALVLFRYVSALRVASTELSHGNTSMLERLLLGIFLVWLFPLMSNARLSVTTRAIQHLPLSLKQLFIVKSVSLFIPPFAWMVVGASLGISYSLAHAPNPLAGISAALLFIILSWLTGLTVAQLMSIAFWRTVGGLIVVAGLFFAGFSRVGPRNSSSILPLLSFSPVTTVARAALGERVWFQLLILSVLTVLAFAAALWSFRASLESTEPSSSE